MDENNEKKSILNGTLDRISFWIGNVDAKASFLLSITGVILGFVLSNESIEKIIDTYLTYIYFHFSVTDLKSYISIINCLIFGLAIFFISRALWAFMNALRGKIDQKKIKQRGLHKKSLLFWGDISNRKYYEYLDDLAKVSLEQLKSDLNSQVYINSYITTTKFTIYNTGIKRIKYGIIFMVIFKLISFIPIFKP